MCYHSSEIIVHDHPGIRDTGLYPFFLKGSLGVQMFFVISGYCIAHAAVGNLRRGDSIGSYLGARARRIYPPYLAALAFALIVVLGAAHTMDQTAIAPGASWPLFAFANVTLTQFALHTSLLLPVSWTLAYEVAFYGLVALAILGARRNISWLWRLQHALTILLLVAMVIKPGQVRYPLDMWPQFGMGILLYDRISRPERNESWIWIISAVLLTIMLIFRPDFLLGMSQRSHLTYAVVLVFSAILLPLFRFDKKIVDRRVIRPFLWLGTISYSLYLTHFFVVRIVHQVLLRLPLRDSSGATSLVLMAACAVGAAALFFHVAERPFLKRAAKSAPIPVVRPSEVS